MMRWRAAATAAATLLLLLLRSAERRCQKPTKKVVKDYISNVKVV